MSARAWLRGATACAIVLGAGLAPAALGCGSDNGLVGGQCAAGYVPCGASCCAAGAGEGGALDGGPDATMADATAEGSLDAPSDGLDASAEGSLLDWRAEDGRIPDGGDGAASDASATDSSSPPDGASDASATDASATDTGATDTGATDAPADTGPVCAPPLVDCGGVCTDTTTDPLNCGNCGTVCPSQLCSNSLCVGTTTGGVVFIGHDYFSTSAGTAQAHVLSNAVLIPQANPLHVMSYERYANTRAVSNVKAIVNAAATAVGRTVTITSTSVDGDIPAQLVWPSFQVLVVTDQATAPGGALATLGASWAGTLATFTAAGGIVVVLDGGTGVDEMPAFSTATGLLSVTADTSVATGTPLLDVAPFDVVGAGVISPYGAGKSSVSVATEPNGGSVVYVIDVQVDGGGGAPVVVHKVL